MCSWACNESTRLELFAPDAGKLDAQAPEDARVPLDGSQPDAATNNHDGGARDAGQPDASADDAGTDENDSRTGLILRYDFSGTGTTVDDRVGGASARIRGGAQLDGTGVLTLDGMDDYVDLPNHTLTRLQSATVMVWVTWSGGACWQRAFDFGRSSGGEDNTGDALASVFVAFSTCPDDNVAAFYEQPPAQYFTHSEVDTPVDRAIQLTLVFDDRRARAPKPSHMTLYLDTVNVGEVDLPFVLSELADDNAWLGRSQWERDAFAKAAYDELRIYDRPLTAAEVAEAVARGPDVP